MKMRGGVRDIVDMAIMPIGVDMRHCVRDVERSIMKDIVVMRCRMRYVVQVVTVPDRVVVCSGMRYGMNVLCRDIRRRKRSKRPANHS